MESFKDWAPVVLFGLVGSLWCVVLWHIAPRDEARQCVDMSQYYGEQYDNGVWSIDGKVLGYSVVEDEECITPR